MAGAPRLARIRKHLKEIFTTGEGQYINEHGETVYGKLPRAKAENPIKTIMRPTFMSEFSNVLNYYPGSGFPYVESILTRLHRLCLLFG